MRTHMSHLLLGSLLGTASLLSVPTASAQSPDRHPLYEPGVPQGGKASAENLFTGAKATASGSFENFKPELAIDGNSANGNQYWGCENLPVWLQIDMGAPKQLSSIHIWPYWADGRIYKYIIEGSNDGKTWKTLVDQSANSITGTAEGSQYSFAPQNVRYVRVTITGNSTGAKSGGHIVEIQGFGPGQSSGLNASAIPAEERMPRTGAPAAGSRLDGVSGKAWRGERINGQVAAWSVRDLKQLRVKGGAVANASGDKIPVQASFIRFTRTGKTATADIIGTETRGELAGGTIRPIWVGIDVPQQAKPGTYKGSIVVEAEGVPAVSVPVSIDVLPYTLPSPDKWKVHLDLWQHPEAVARYHNVEPWSPEHFAIMKPLMKRLADAGQKTITCSLIDEAWGGQTYDWWPAMIEWTKGKDGKLHYDYANFDKWVAFMLNDVGIKDQIICYTMLPWSLKVRYMDEATGDYKHIDLKPGDASFENVWGPFLADFQTHLKKKGWFDKACIGIDERPDHFVRAAKAVIDKHAPGMKIASAVNAPSATTRVVYDLSPGIQHANTVLGDVLKERKANGLKTTFYVCCNPDKPNTFTTSPLPESEWLGLFAAANDLDGFLRWAYNSWGRNPFETTDFGNWKSGDCYLVYPGNLTSMRFEKLRDGLENFEKIRILREQADKSPAAKAAVDKMNSELKGIFTIQRSRGNEHAADVKRANAIINETAAAVSPK